MDESFSTTTSISSSTGGGGAATAKVLPPAGDPNDNWTIEELLRWSLEQYRSKVIEQTASNIASLRAQCENECEDVLKLHEEAVQLMMSAKNNTKLGEKEDAAVAGGGSTSSNYTRRRGEENTNPQVDHAQRPTTTKAAAATTATAIVIGDMDNSNPTTACPTAAISTTAGSATFTGTSNNTNNTSADPIAAGTIEVTVTVGPHSSTTYTLHPTIDAPCLVGRSKGKKFVKNGISLFKDQEVSTTHGKFIVEMKENDKMSGGGGSSSSPPVFYFVDVGSTNGTVYNGVALVPHQRLLLENGMELKVGNSVLKVLLG